MTSSNYHYSVLIEEILNKFPIIENGVYVDCTLGMGGYSKRILNLIPKTATLICFDKDEFAINNFKKYLNENNIKNVILINDDFVNLKSHLNKLEIDKIDWIVYDLGVSSPQIDNPERGFSYKNNGPLDMRMDTKQSIRASDVINSYPFEKIVDIFKKYGESKYSYNVAKKIVEERQKKHFETTFELVDVIKKSLPLKELNKNKHPAKVFFQAIRIEVNQELSFLEDSIYEAANMLNNNGKMQVVTFHSLEDKIIKETFKKLTTSKIPSYVPTKVNDVEFKTKKSIKPSLKELNENSRSKSAKLRILIRKENDEK